MLLVKKKEGSWRCCVDYRALNTITVKDRFSMSTIDELLDELGKASWFSKLDLQQGFHQIHMVDEDIPKMAFRTHHGYFEYKVMTLRLCNAPSTFQVTMNNLLRSFLRKFVTIFFDNILVLNPSIFDHLEHLEIVLTTLSRGQFFFHCSKCLFAQKNLHYLGHIVSADGMAPDADKIQAIMAWLTPSSQSEL